MITSHKKIGHAQQYAAITHVSTNLPKGSRIYGRVAYVNSTGMTRRVHLYTIVENRIWDLTLAASQVLRGSYHARHGLAVHGCGFCPVQHVVERLAYAVHLQATDYEYERL